MRTNAPLVRGALLAALFALGPLVALHANAAPPPLPALPGPNAPPATQAPAPASPPAAPGWAPAPVPAPDTNALVDKAKRGVVQVERDGRPLGAGMILANDGRVVTSLSTLGASDSADVRYTDGHVVKSRVGHRDKAWDLALLVPLSGRWTEGLVASEADPQGIELKMLGPSRAGKAPPSLLSLKGRADVRSREGETIPGALDLETRSAPLTPGAPVIDSTGSVIAILVHACRPAAPAAAPAPGAAPANGAAAPNGTGGAAPCTQLVVGAPVPALRNFLVRTPLNAVQPSPWLGIVGAPDKAGNVNGVRVVAIAPQSPAEKGGLKTNPDRAAADLIAAVDGQPVETPESLADLIGKHAIGESVKLLVFSGDKFRELSVVLRAAP